MVVDSEDFTKLPVGKYQLEIWEQWNDVDGTSQLSIYPSPQQTIPFTIYANITDQAGKEIKEIGFQDVVDQAVMNIGMNYVFKVNTVGPDDKATVVQAASGGYNYQNSEVYARVKRLLLVRPKLSVIRSVMTRRVVTTSPCKLKQPLNGYRKRGKWSGLT